MAGRAFPRAWDDPPMARRMKQACRDCAWCNRSNLARMVRPAPRAKAWQSKCGVCRHPLKRHASGDLSDPTPTAAAAVSAGVWAVCPTDPPGVLRWWDANGWGATTMPAPAPTQ
jgi:hypothetical protein